MFADSDNAYCDFNRVSLNVWSQLQHTQTYRQASLTPFVGRGRRRGDRWCLQAGRGGWAHSGRRHICSC